MSCFNFKATILFWAVLIFAVIALISGEFEDAKYLFITLIIGALAYQIIMWAVRGVSGYDIQTGTDREERKLNRDIRYAEKEPVVAKKKEKTKKEKTFKCKFCNKKFVSENAVEQHTKAKHGKSKK